MAKSQTFTAGCSAVGSFSYAGNFTLYVVLTDRDGSSSTNVSQVDYNVYCQSNGSGSISAKHYKYFSINGSEKKNVTESVNVSSPYAYISIASGTISVTHNSDGSKTIPFSAQIKASSYGVSASVSGNFELEKIPRYTTVTNSTRGRTINTISVNWATTDARDHTQYSLNGGSWTDAGDTVASDNKSGYYTISGLSANTKYTVKTRCKRTDSQLWSESTSTLTITTYDIAKITEAPNFTDEGNPTIKYSNPFGSNVTKLQACISLTGAKDDVAYRDISKTETSYTFNLTDAERKVLRQAAKTNSLSVTFFLRTTYGQSYHSTVVRTMSIVNANPTFSNFTYQDTDSTTLALTGNNQTIIKGYSNVKGIVSAANKASPKKEASMSKYRLSIGEKTAEVAYSSSAEVSTSISDVTTNSFTMYAIDSRGNSTAKTITAANYINYAPIKITSITVLRTNSVTSETTLKFSGYVWNGSFGSVTNSIVTCYYRYRLSTSSTWTTGATTITPTKSGTSFSFSGIIAGDLGATGFDIDNSYVIQVIVADKLSGNSSSPATFTLGPGTPAMAIYKNNVAIGQRYDTSDDSKLQVNGKTRIKGDLSVTGNSYANTKFVAYVGSDTSGAAGWYKVASQTMSGHGNTNILYFIKAGYNSGFFGFLDLEMRSNQSSISCWQCKWLIRHGFSKDHVRIVISGMTWTLYVYNPSGQYGRVQFSEIQHMGINNYKQYSITYYNSTTKESTEPTASYTTTELNSNPSKLDPYPVGSIYMNWTHSKTPAELFGGTWVQMTGGFLYGSVGTASSASGSTGNGTGTSTSSHAITEAQMPSHRHKGLLWGGVEVITLNEGSNGGYNLKYGGGNNYQNDAVQTALTGSGQGHSHSVPYMAVMIWRRTA